MKSKLKILSLILLLVTLSTCLSSCYLLTTDISSSLGNGGTNISVGNVNNYDVDVSVEEDPSIVSTAKALMSVVSVSATFKKTTPSFFGGGTTTQESSSWGSGVIFKLTEDKSTAYILTNYHVVYSGSVSSDISVYLYGMESYRDQYLDSNGKDTLGYGIKATYVGGSMAYDLAVLKVENSELLMRSNAQACTFADSNDVAILETAIAIGNAKGHGISATMGRINVDSEYIAMLGPDDTTTVIMRVMRTDAAVNEGNSGGGLFNEKGELIGIVNAKIIDSTVDNIGYAIPSNVAKYIAEGIIHYCDGNPSNESVKKCKLNVTLGIKELYTEYDEEKAALYKKEKVFIEEMDDSSPVKDILKVGDVITSVKINETVYEISRTFHLIDSMLNARVGDTVAFSIVRDGENTTATIVMTDSMLETQA